MINKENVEDRDWEGEEELESIQRRESQQGFPPWFSFNPMLSELVDRSCHPQ